MEPHNTEGDRTLPTFGDATLTWRRPTMHEQSLLEALSRSDFVGQREVALQCGDLLVAPLDSDGGLALAPLDVAPNAPTIYPVPVEGIVADEDGVLIHALLHVVEGRVRELEVFREDGKPLRRDPEIPRLQILTL